MLSWQADGAPRIAGPTPPVFREATTVRIDSTVHAEVGADTPVQVDGTPTVLTGSVVLTQGSSVVFPAGPRCRT